MTWNYKEIRVTEETRHLVRPNGMCLEHRVEAEKMLGRKLLSKEHVHHVDGNVRNNKHDNLMVFFTRADHVRFHANQIAILQKDGLYISPFIGTKRSRKLKQCPDVTSICKICGGEKAYSVTDHCPSCASKLQRKVKRPSKDTLIQDVKSMSMCAVGRKYGISDNGIRRWLDAYNLPKSSKYWRKQLEV